MRTRTVLGVAIVSAYVASGCVGRTAQSGASAATASGPFVELQVWNRTDARVIAYAWWGSGRVRLGEIAANGRGIYATPLEGPSVGMSWEVVSGGRPLAADNGGDRRGSSDLQCEAAVSAGDRIEWTIAMSGATSGRAVNLRDYSRAEASCSVIRLDPAP